jgi:hypothetical protein
MNQLSEFNDPVGFYFNILPPSLQKKKLIPGYILDKRITDQDELWQIC